MAAPVDKLAVCSQHAGMRVTVGAFEAKNKLSGLIERVWAGDEVWITRRGKPVAKLLAVDPAELEARPRFGCLKGRVRLGEDFEEPLPMHHRDPFDRLLIAQAILEGAAVVSRDEQFAAYSVRRIW